MRKFIFVLILLTMLSVGFAKPRIPVAEIIVKTSGASSDAWAEFVRDSFSTVTDSTTPLLFLYSGWEMSDAMDTYVKMAYFVFDSSDDSVNTPWGGIDAQLEFQGTAEITDLRDSLKGRIGADESKISLRVDHITEDIIYVGVALKDTNYIDTFLRLFVAILENDVIVSSKEYDWVVRDIFPGGLGELVLPTDTLDTIYTVAYSRSYAWYPPNCMLAMWVDRTHITEGREIFESLHIPFPLSEYMLYVKNMSGTNLVGSAGDTLTFKHVVFNYGANEETLRIDLTVDAFPAGWDYEIEYKGSTFTSSSNFNLGFRDIDTLKFNIFTNPAGLGTAKFKFLYTADNASDSFAYQLAATTGDSYIIVNDDYYNRGYETYYFEAMESLGHQYFHYRTAWVPYRQTIYPVIKDFKNVIWYTANNTSTLGGSDRSSLAKFLQGGGKLFITGSRIIRDLCLDGRYTDYEFVEHILRSSSSSRALKDSATLYDTSGVMYIHGISRDFISDGFNFPVNDCDGANNMGRMNVIQPIAGAIPFFYYGKVGTEECAALRYSNNPWGVVFLAFGFEAIDSTSRRVILMDRILKWLADSSSIQEGKAPKPDLLSLSIQPNPFNAICEINFSTPVKGNLEILDISGRRIYVTEVEGSGKLTWDASDRTSGIYLIRIIANGKTVQKKIVLLK